MCRALHRVCQIVELEKKKGTAAGKGMASSKVEGGQGSLRKVPSAQEARGQARGYQSVDRGQQEWQGPREQRQQGSGRASAGRGHSRSW